MTDLLRTILDSRRADARRLLEDRSLHDWESEAAAAPPTPSFLEALQRPPTGIIAEIKRSSPSAGAIREDVDPIATARAYELGGAVAISILTEPRGFSGSLSDLETVGQVVGLPLLRKDFLFSGAQVCEGKMAGASAVLAIVRFLSDEELDEFWTVSQRTGVDVLVEAHDEDDVHRALQWDFPIIGVNCRNLETLSVDLSVHQAMRGSIPSDRVAVAESGIKDTASFSHVSSLGYDAVLMGEAVMRHPDPARFLAELTAENA